MTDLGHAFDLRYVKTVIYSEGEVRSMPSLHVIKWAQIV